MEFKVYHLTDFIHMRKFGQIVCSKPRECLN